MSLEETKIFYYINNEEQPYLVKVRVAPDQVTLGDFKRVLSRTFETFIFKSVDADLGIVKEKITDENAKLPFVGDKVVAWVESSECRSSFDSVTSKFSDTTKLSESNISIESTPTCSMFAPSNLDNACSTVQPFASPSKDNQLILGCRYGSHITINYCTDHSQIPAQNLSNQEAPLDPLSSSQAIKSEPILLKQSPLKEGQAYPSSSSQVIKSEPVLLKQSPLKEDQAYPSSSSQVIKSETILLKQSPSKEGQAYVSQPNVEQAMIPSASNHSTSILSVTEITPNSSDQVQDSSPRAVKVKQEIPDCPIESNPEITANSSDCVQGTPLLPVHVKQEINQSSHDRITPVESYSQITPCPLNGKADQFHSMESNAKNTPTSSQHGTATLSQPVSQDVSQTNHGHIALKVESHLENTVPRMNHGQITPPRPIGSNQNLTQTSLNTSSVTSSPKKSFFCDWQDCHKVFDYRCQLKRHYVKHINVKPYVCKYCQKAFHLQGSHYTHQKKCETKYILRHNSGS